MVLTVSLHLCDLMYHRTPGSDLQDLRVQEKKLYLLCSLDSQADASDVHTRYSPFNKNVTK